MLKHPHQRIGVFIDVQNMYYSAKNLYNSKVEFGQILETAVAGRQLIRGIAYVVEATGEETPFFDALHARGLETKSRPLQVFDSGAKKADWDVGIAVDAIRIGEILDVVVLVTGDGDFVELVEYLKQHGRRVEVVAFGQTTATKLKDACDDFIDLGKDLERFLIKPPAGGATRNPTRRTRTPREGAEPKEIKEAKEPKGAGAKDERAAAAKEEPAATPTPSTFDDIRFE